jgi:hypothetical protein
MLPRYEVAAPVGPKPVSATAKKASKKRMETAKRAKAARDLEAEVHND